MDPSDASAKFKVGNRVKLTLKDGQELEGDVYCYDPSSSLIVLQEEIDRSGKRTLRIVRATETTASTVLSTNSASIEPTVQNVPPSVVKSRLEHALATAKADALKYGVGVTQDAQNIYTTLSKILPCKWEKDVIVVMDEVKIASPYTNATGTHSDSVAKVQKMLDGARRKLRIN